MAVRVEHSYAVSPEQVFRVLTDPAYLTEKGRRYGGAAAPEVKSAGGEVVVTTVRKVTADKLPSIAKRYVGDGVLVETDRWSEATDDGTAYRASLTVDTGGIPIAITGSHEIRAVPSGCDYVITLETSVQVPLVGRAIRMGVEGQMKKLLTAELAFTERWLSDQVD